MRQQESSLIFSVAKRVHCSRIFFAQATKRENEGKLRDETWVRKRGKQLQNKWILKELRRNDISEYERGKLEKQKEFGAKRGWYRRFLVRSQLKPRTITCKKKLSMAEFKRLNAIWLPRARRNISESHPSIVDNDGKFKSCRLYNLDEVPVQLINKVAKQVGSKDNKRKKGKICHLDTDVTTRDANKRIITLVLIIAADGFNKLNWKKMKPLVILPGLCFFSHQCYVLFH